MSNFIFSETILIWYQNTRKQNFPWQLNKTIYTVWLSEIMLQQTQVTTVVPYYKKFLQTFPTISKLATADLNEVLYIWSGLGYYNRAINLHKTAKIIMQNYNGIFPQDFKTILSFPGIGKSTAGAILSLALNQRYPILDSNIQRILTRYYALNYHTFNKSKPYKTLWLLIDKLLPNTNVSIFNQAIMDLGRTICTYTHPLCNICPIHDHCTAFLTNNINQHTSKKTICTTTTQTVLWILLLSKQSRFIWLIKRSQEKIWNKLFCFPEFYNTYALDIWILKHNLYKNQLYSTNILKRKISNINLEIHPILINLIKPIKFTKEIGIWYDLNNPPTIGLPKPVHIILHKLKQKLNQIPIIYNKLNYIQKIF